MVYVPTPPVKVCSALESRKDPTVLVTPSPQSTSRLIAPDKTKGN